VERGQVGEALDWDERHAIGSGATMSREDGRQRWR